MDNENSENGDIFAPTITDNKNSENTEMLPSYMSSLICICEFHLNLFTFGISIFPSKLWLLSTAI